MRGIYKPRAERFDHRLLNDGRYMYRVWDPDGSDYQVIFIVPGEDATLDVLAALDAMDTEERLDDRHQDEVTDFDIDEDELKSIRDESAEPEHILFDEEQMSGPEMLRLIEAIGKLTPAQIDLFRDLFALQIPLSDVARRDDVSRQAIMNRKNKILNRLAKLMAE